MINISQEEFDNMLADVIDDKHSAPSDLLDIPGIYEILSEYYNNEVLERFEDEE